MEIATQYEPHDLIFIDGNANFSLTAAQEGWIGDGTPTNPFLIQGLKVTYSNQLPFKVGGPGTLITIKNVDVHFKIKDNQIVGIPTPYVIQPVLTGILFVNVSNGEIINDFFVNCTGIHLSSTYSVNITNNMLISELCPVYSSGIDLYFSNHTDIVNNTIVNNIGFGIFSTYSNNNRIIGNTIKNANGVILADSQNITVISNNFIGNNLDDSSSQAWSNLENNFTLNFWDTWTSPDDDADGIVDLPYLIDDPAKNRDPYPVVASYSIYAPIPILTNTNEVEKTLLPTIPVLFALSLITIILRKKKKKF